MTVPGKEVEEAASFDRFLSRWRTGPGSTRGGEGEWLTLGQAAKYLGVAQSTIRKWTDAGRLPAFKTPGGHRRYRRGDLDAFLERSQPGGGAGRVRSSSSSTTTPGCAASCAPASSSTGYSVREAGSADEGLAVLEEKLPDLILLDVMMPQVDGWEMLRRVQEQHGAGAIPVLMFSGKVDERAAAEAAVPGRAAASSASRSIRSS